MSRLTQMIFLFSRSWAGESCQHTPDVNLQPEEPSFEPQPCGLYEKSGPLIKPQPGYGDEGVSLYCLQGILYQTAADDTFHPCAREPAGEHHSISSYQLTSWFNGAACRVPPPFMVPHTSASREGRSFCPEGRSEELRLHPGCRRQHHHQSHFHCVLHREKGNDKSMESYGLHLWRQSNHVGALPVSEEVYTGCKEEACRGGEQQQEPHSTKETSPAVISNEAFPGHMEHGCYIWMFPRALEQTF